MSETPASWTPSFRNFLLRFFLVGLLTSLAYGLLPTGLREADPLTFWLTLLVTLFLSPLLWGFVFDDHLRWMRHRRKRWELLPDRLRLHDGTGEATDLMLHEISAAKATLFGGVRITRTDGRSLIARYIPRPRAMAGAITTAIAAHLAPS